MRFKAAGQDAMGSWTATRRPTSPKPAPAGPKAKRPPGARATPRGIAAKDPREEQKGIAQNWQNQSCVGKAVYGVGGGCAVNWFSILGGSRYHFGRRCGETTAPSTDQFGNTAAQHRLAGPYPSDPTGEDTSSTARAWR